MAGRGGVPAGLIVVVGAWLAGCADGGALGGALSAQAGSTVDARLLAPAADAGATDAAGCRPERCDGQDDDCDGRVDEGACAACAAGDFAPCYDGAAETLNVGVCRAGLQRCGDDGHLLPCAGQILPAAEVCNSADDDCDGATDEDFAAQVGQACTVGVGGCAAAGTFLCDADGQRCAGEPGPQAPESCNGVDDDCDGRFDEAFGVGEPCAVGVGACRREGLVGCGDDGGACQARAGLPVAEQCNGVDDDCDGATDEGEASCYTGPPETRGVGRCRSGRGACGGECVGQVLPAEEACDGQDDDCDGVVDNRGGGCRCDPEEVVDCYEGEGQPGVGRCAAGRRTCAADRTFGPCLDQIGPAEEACNGQDDDCDGAVDESLARACGADVGRCQQGQQVCERGRFGPCADAIGPAAEACNGVDDDCDGATDEGLTRACGTDVGACQAGTQRCDAGGWGACEGGLGPAGERCNGADDDCDGATDEGVTNACGGCGAVPAEACDGVDQDCDGRVDEQVMGPVPAEACNGRDDDCDGRADEGLGADCRPCAAAGDCDDGNPCTDDRCQAGRCVFTDNDAACDDGVFCNGDDVCSGGGCAVHQGRDCGRDVCSPALDRCVQCLAAADCPVPAPPPFGPCAFPSECAPQGTQERVVDEPRCADGLCELSQRVEQEACQRNIEGNACSAGVCLAGVCTPQRTITARLAGDFTPAGRARLACAQGGQACVASWGSACSVACAEGTEVIACCSNGSACGGAERAPDFNVLLVQITLGGLVEPDYAPFAPGQDQEAHATATVGAGAGTLECGYFNINIPFP